jgi:hypothetical protein
VYIVPIIHACITAIGDLVYLIFLKKFFKKDIAYKAMACRLFNFYNLYSSTRSLTNNIEEFFAICILASFKRDLDLNKNFWFFHLFAFLSFVIRATSAINLIPIYIYQFFHLIKENSIRFKFILQFILVGYILLYTI